MSWNRPNGIETKDIGKFLREADNVQLMKLQDASTILALKNPQEFIETRQTQIDQLYSDTGSMVAYYKFALDDYIKMGLPETDAHRLAYEASTKIRDTNLKALELKYPGGYEKSMGVAKTDHNNTLAIANTADAELVKQATKGKDHYRRKYKNKYKGKVSSK